MADFDIIADVSEAFRKVLDDAISTLPQVGGQSQQAVLHDLIVSPSFAVPTLTVYLYEVNEDFSVRNRPDVRDLVAGNRYRVRRAPMGLQLRYLLTPWNGDTKSDHRLIGRAMQALRENASIAVTAHSRLDGVTATVVEDIKVTISPLNVDERSRVWFAIQKPYRLSVAYELRVANIEVHRGRVETPVSNVRRDLAHASSEVTS